jgi:Tol biopolymer transport system component
VSPNGEWIAYSRFFLDLGANLFDDADDEFSQPAIHAYNLNDGRIVRVTNGSLREDQPTWSPDGRFIAFAANLGAAGQPEIYRVPFDPDEPAEAREPGGAFTDGRQRLTNTVDQLKLPESSLDPTWLRNGQIVFTSTQRPPCTSRRIRNLWIMNGDGSNRRPLVVSAEDDNFPFAANYDYNDPMADDMIVFSSRRNPDDSFEGQKMDLWVLRGGF